MKNKLEVCCGSYQDALAAQAGGADRIELNTALHLGGLTPSIVILEAVKKAVSIPVVCMVRERGAGFCYDETECELLYLQAEALLQAGADSIAFGFLHADHTIDRAHTKKMVELIHAHQKEAVFHSAFDCVKDGEASIRCLIELGVDRVLTSGLSRSVTEGMDRLKMLQKRYGDQIEILAGCGVNEGNVELLLAQGIKQVHSSCKTWIKDPTTIQGDVSYAYAQGEQAECYDAVDQRKVAKLAELVHR